MKKILIITAVIIQIMYAGCDKSNDSVKSDSGKADYQIRVEYRGPDVFPYVVYSCWIEDQAGNNIQNIYVCNRLVGIGNPLLGDALPYWSTVKYPANTDIDGVTGASVQQRLTVIRNLYLNETRRFRVYFEIDRSRNTNAYFTDRPAFIYRSTLIDLDSLEAEYALQLMGWMANGTDSGDYSQAPLSAISEYEPYKLMTGLSYIEDPDDHDYDDMVTSLSVEVAAK